MAAETEIALATRRLTQAEATFNQRADALEAIRGRHQLAPADEGLAADLARARILLDDARETRASAVESLARAEARAAADYSEFGTQDADFSSIPSFQQSHTSISIAFSIFRLLFRELFFFLCLTLSFDLLYIQRF